MPASIPHNTALGTPINQSPVPITRPKAEFNANWDRKSRLRRSAASLRATVVFCKSCDPASLIKRFRKSSRCSNVKITKMITMPEVIRGWSKGEIKAAMLSSAVGGGCLTSTGIGRASCAGTGFAVRAATAADVGSFGLLSSLPRSCSTLERIVRRRGSAQGLNFGPHIGFIERQLTGELRHLRSDHAANGENNGKCQKDDADHRNR